MQRRKLPPVKAERQQSCRGEALPPPGEAGRAAPCDPAPVLTSARGHQQTRAGVLRAALFTATTPGRPPRVRQRENGHPGTADLRGAGPQTARSQKLWKQNPFLGSSTGGKSRSEEPGGHSSPVSVPGRVSVRRADALDTRSNTRLGRYKARSVLHFTRCASQPQMNICMMYHLCSETHWAPRALGKGLRTCLVLQWKRLQLGKQTNTNYTHLCG